MPLVWTCSPPALRYLYTSGVILPPFCIPTFGTFSSPFDERSLDMGLDARSLPRWFHYLATCLKTRLLYLTGRYYPRTPVLVYIRYRVGLEREIKEKALDITICTGPYGYAFTDLYTWVQYTTARPHTWLRSARSVLRIADTPVRAAAPPPGFRFLYLPHTSSFCRTPRSYFTLTLPTHHYACPTLQCRVDSTRQDDFTFLNSPRWAFRVTTLPGLVRLLRLPDTVLPAWNTGCLTWWPFVTRYLPLIADAPRSR